MWFVHDGALFDGSALIIVSVMCVVCIGCLWFAGGCMWFSWVVMVCWFLVLLMSV